MTFVTRCSFCARTRCLNCLFFAVLVKVSDKPTFSLGECARLLKTTMASEGILGLWRGNSATLLRVLPYAGLHFMTHEALEQHFRNHQEGQRLSL